MKPLAYRNASKPPSVMASMILAFSILITPFLELYDFALCNLITSLKLFFFHSSAMICVFLIGGTFIIT